MPEPACASQAALTEGDTRQFEVVAHRLALEYGIKTRIMPGNFNLARWVDKLVWYFRPRYDF